MAIYIKKYGVRRFSEWRNDGRCFELYTIADGQCASFPGTRKELEVYAKKRNEDECLNKGLDELKQYGV